MRKPIPYTRAAWLAFIPAFVVLLRSSGGVPGLLSGATAWVVWFAIIAIVVAIINAGRTTFDPFEDEPSAWEKDHAEYYQSDSYRAED